MGLPKNIDYTQCIYGLHEDGGPIRYVGHARYAAERLALHKLRAKKGTHDHLPVYQWMHEAGLNNIHVTVLAKFQGEWDINEVCEEEKRQIALWRQTGYLTNLTDGGFTAHLPSMLRGDRHPRFGKKLSAEHKEALAEGRKEYFENMSDEDREKFSIKSKQAWENLPDEKKAQYSERSIKGQRKWLAEASKDEIQRVKSRGPHVRHHVKGEKPNPECQHCINEKLV